MLRFAKTSLSTALLLLVILAFAGFYILEPVPIKVVRHYLFDQYQQWHPRPAEDVGVRVIDIDDESLQKIGQWPWPRSRIAVLLGLLKGEQKAIGIDFIFSEPDRTSPAEMLKLWQVPASVSGSLGALPDHDQLLATALVGQHAVLGFSGEHTPSQGGGPIEPFRFIRLGDSAYPFLPGFTSALKSLPILEEQAVGSGAIIFIPDVDGVVRKVPLLVRIQDGFYPSFALELLRVVLNQKNYLVKTTAKHEIGVEHLMVGSFTIPTTSAGEMWVYYSPIDQARTIPAWKIMNGEVSAASLKDKILLLGSSGRGVTDLRFAPGGAIIPGVEVHAQLLEQMLTQHFLIRPNWAIALEVVMLLLLLALVAVMAFNTGILKSFFSMLGAVCVLMGGAWLLFLEGGYLVDGLTPAFFVVLMFMLCSTVRHRLNEKHQRWVRSLFSRYVSPNLVSYLIAHPEQMELNGRRQECSFILTDLSNSTRLTESIEPAALAHRLNAYLDRMIAIAFQYDGTLTRIVGDGLVIMFSAPVVQPDHRRRAVLCALEMQAFAKVYVAELRAQGLDFCDTRIGVNTGTVLVGNFGGSTIFDYRALGDAINTASRLEGVNRYLGTSLCIADETLIGCDEVISRPVGRLLLKGKAKPLLAYEPLGMAGQQPALQLDVEYEQAYSLLHVDSFAALQAFKALASSRPNDVLVAFHLDRLVRGEKGDVVVLQEK